MATDKLTIWSLHPFPSLVKVPEYPDVALADVWRTRVKLEDDFSFAGRDMVRPAMLADHEVVKRLSIEEKIEFRRWVMRHAKDRGIDVYVFTWNAFTFGAEGKHGITNEIENPITKAYFRASVRELITTYPLLAGLGITAGEGMPEKMDSKVKEQWLCDTYGEGVRDALKIQPQRVVRMIHRFHWTAQCDILDAWKAMQLCWGGLYMPGRGELCQRLHELSALAVPAAATGVRRIVPNPRRIVARRRSTVRTVAVGGGPRRERCADEAVAYHRRRAPLRPPLRRPQPPCPP